jgi:hypothetical protein
MGTLSEYAGNGNSPETSQHLADPLERIDGLLEHFAVLPSGLDRFLFKYIYVLLIGNFFLGELLVITIFLLGTSSFPTGELLLGGGLNGFITVIFIVVLWRFNVWRLRTPKTLDDLIEKKRISVPEGEANTPYLRFLENYGGALASRKRYFLTSSLVILVIIVNAPGIVQDITIGYPVGHPNVLVTLLSVIDDLFWVLVSMMGVYCIGIVCWTMYISGWYIRKLVRVFELNIQPFHTDQCGGLKILGNFCFSLVSPVLFGSGLLIGYILLVLFTDNRGDLLGQTLTVGSALLVLLVYAFPAAIFAFILPLRDIHTKMMSEGETDEDSYNAHLQALRQEIQSLLATNQVEEAKVVQEKKAVVETLHTAYPTWPFRFRSKIFSTSLGVSGSLLTGMIAAALQQYFLPAIFSLLFHHP